MKLLRHLAGYAPVNLAAAIASFGGVYVFTRVLGADEYGRYSVMLSALALIHTVSLTWAEAANYRFSAHAEASGTLPNHYRTGLRLMLRSLALSALILLVLAVALKDQPEYLIFLPFIALLLPLNTIVQMALEAHRAGQRVGRYAAVETSRLLIGFALGGLLAWQIGLGAVAPFVGLAVASFMFAVSEGPWLLKQAKGGVSSAQDTKAWLGYGMPIAAALVLDILLSAADRFLILHYLGEAAVGQYTAGYGVADKTVLLICAWAAMAGSPLMMAAYERGGKQAAREEARGLAGTLLLVGMPAATGLALVAQPLAEAMIGAEVREQAMRIIPWIAFAGLLNGLLIHYFSEVFQLARKTGERALLMIVPAGLNIVLNIFLLQTSLGIMGAVYATLISYGVGIVLLGSVGRRHVALPLPLLEASKIAIACVAMWPCLSFMPEWGAWPELFAKAFAGGLVYGATVYILDAGGARKFVRNLRRSSNSFAEA